MSSAQKGITYDEFKAAFEAHEGRCLVLNEKRMNDNKTKDKHAQFDTCWLGILFKDAEGVLKPLDGEFENQILGGKAKFPKQSSAKKYLVIPFYKMDAKVIATGDYVAKDPSNEKAVKKMEEKVARIIENNIQFTGDGGYLDLINIACRNLYDDICEMDKSDTSPIPFTVNKTPGGKDPNFIGVKQTHFEEKLPGKKAKKIPLQNPIYRMRLNIVNYERGDKRVANKIMDSIKPILYDVSKMTKENKYAAVQAYGVKTTGDVKTKILIDADTAPQFVSYKSLVSGKFSLRDISSSAQGISFPISVKRLYVLRHATTQEEPTYDESSVKAMKGMGEDDSDNEIEAEDAELELAGTEAETSPAPAKPSKKAPASKSASKVSKREEKRKADDDPEEDDNGDIHLPSGGDDDADPVISDHEDETLAKPVVAKVAPAKAAAPAKTPKAAVDPAAAAGTATAAKPPKATKPAKKKA